jgi:hypothetical protein
LCEVPLQEKPSACHWQQRLAASDTFAWGSDDRLAEGVQSGRCRKLSRVAGAKLKSGESSMQPCQAIHETIRQAYLWPSHMQR